MYTTSPNQSRFCGDTALRILASLLLLCSAMIALLALCILRLLRAKQEGPTML